MPETQIINDNNCLNIMSQSERKISKNPQIMRLSYNYRSDLRVSWSFYGLLMPQQFRRHIFIYASESFEHLKRLIQIAQFCYESFKTGDLYSVLSLKSRKIKWSQKSDVNQFKCSKKLSKDQRKELQSIKIDSFAKGLKQHLKQLGKCAGPTFVTLYCDDNLEVHEIQGIIMGERETQNISCLFFIVSDKVKLNIIDFSKGIVWINFTKKGVQSIGFLHRFYDKHLACLQAELIIESLSGQIYSNSQPLISKQFSCLSRKIYYPIAQNYSDIIQTHLLSNVTELKVWNFRIKLKYQLLNGDEFYSQKLISLPLDVEIDKSGTFERMGARIHDLSWNLQLDDNPFETHMSISPGIIKSTKMMKSQ